jgi:lysosomal Pro-X carboxypeptidase
VNLALWLQGAFDYMAMGSYPYPSSYILNGEGMLPAYPMRAACQGDVGSKPLKGMPLLAGIRDAAAIFYNATIVTCFDTAGSANAETLRDGIFWDYLYCAGMIQPFSRNGNTDMFWSQPFNATETEIRCTQQWGVPTGRTLWPALNYGGWTLNGATNLVFSNGGSDPWTGGGVTRNLSASASVVAVVIPEVVLPYLLILPCSFNNPATITDAHS